MTELSTNPYITPEVVEASVSDRSMHTSLALRICVVLEWVVIVFGIALSFSLESSLPGELQEWVAAEADAELTVSELVALVVLIPTAISALVASIGLFLLKRWGAWLYLMVHAIGYAMTPLMGPVVEHSIADMVDELSIMLSGMIIALAFFSDALGSRSARMT